MQVGIQTLYRFPTTTRAELSPDAYNKPFDPSRPVKSWIDPQADPAAPSIDYQVFDSTKGALVTLTLTGTEAASYNLTGAPTYAPYVVAPSGATRGGAGVNPIYLSTQADAQALMTQVGGHSLADEGASSVFPVSYAASENRRLWYFMWNGRAQNVGELLYARNKAGVGSPGHWDLNGQDVAWVADPPAPTGLGQNLEVTPVPCRALQPDEQFVHNSVGGWSLQQGADASSSSGITDQQYRDLYAVATANQQTLADVSAKLDKLLSALRLA